MNENEIKSQIGNAIAGTEDHPLHMLNNQVDPIVKAKGTESMQKPIYTYESDLAEALSRQKSSIVSISVAESEKKYKHPAPVAPSPPPSLAPVAPSPPPSLAPVAHSSPASLAPVAPSSPPSLAPSTTLSPVTDGPPSQNGKKLLILFISLLLIFSGLAGSYYLYLQSPFAVPALEPLPGKIPSVINSDTQQIVNIASFEKDQLSKLISSQFSKQSTNTDKINELIFLQSNGSSTVRLSASKFIDSVGLTMSDPLKRSLTDLWMTGVYTSSKSPDQNIPFILFTTDFFQNAFAGMLKWESTMPEDLIGILNYQVVGTSTAIASYFNLKGTFKDKVVLNRDVRQFISTNGNPLFLYTFIDKDTILITTSELVIPAILSRIEKQTYVR